MDFELANSLLAATPRKPAALQSAEVFTPETPKQTQHPDAPKRGGSIKRIENEGDPIQKLMKGLHTF